MDERATPDEFEVYIGGFASLSYGLWWDGAQLVYETFGDAFSDRRQVTVSPSPAQWAKFWRTLDELDVWAWEDRYVGTREQPGATVRDGVHWSLTIRRGEQSISSAGDNSGPSAVNHDESEDFAAFTEAVSRLTGGYPFA